MANYGTNAINPVTMFNTSDADFWYNPKPITDAKGGKLEIIIDGVTYTTPIGPNGEWSFTPPNGWAEGMHAVQVRSIDRATNYGPPSTFIVNFDQTPPKQPEIWRAVDSTGNDKGNLTPGESSDEHKPVLSGVAEPGSIVYLYDNAGTTPIGSTQANKMGAWTITPDLGDGTHSLTITSQDATKNTSVKSAPFELKIAAGAVVFAEQGVSDAPVEESKPVDFGTLAHDKEGLVPVHLNRRVINASSTAEKEAGGLVQVVINNQVYSAKIGTDGKWSIPMPELDDGTYVYQVRYRDRAGNWGDAKQTIVIIEADPLEAPQIMRVIDDMGPMDYLTSNQYTNDNSPELSGVAVPGSLVTIFGTDSQAIASFKAGDDGRWSYTPTLTNDGTYAFSVSYKITYGSGAKATEVVSPKSDNFVINLDTSIPNTPTLKEVFDDEGRSKGPLKSGDYTDDKTPTLSGEGTAGSIIRIWDGATLIASTTVNNEGKWKLDLDLDEGTHNLSVDAIAKGGNTSPGKTADFTLIIDSNILPPVQIEEVVANNTDKEIPLKDGDSTNDATPVLRGTGNDGDIVYVREDGVDLGSAKVVDGKWEIEVPDLEEGPHELVVQVGDAAGDKRSGDSEPVNLIIDLTAPEQPSKPEIIDNEGDKQGPVGEGEAIDDNRPEFKGGDADEGDIVEVIIKDEDGKEEVIGSVRVGPGGDWSITPEDNIPDGEYEVIVVITDPAGNTSEPSEPVKIIIDTDIPAALTGFTLEDDVGLKQGPIKSGDFTDDTKPTISGAGVDGTTVVVYDGNNPIGSVKVVGGMWELELPTRQEGAHSITVQPVSASGVKGPMSDSINFTVDTTAPTTGTFDGVFMDFTGTEQPVVNPDPDQYDYASVKDNTLIMKGTGTNGDIVVLYGDVAHTQVLGSVVVTGGEWKIETGELPDEVYHFNIGVRDKAGNEYLPGTTIKIEVDTQDPLPPIVELDSIGEPIIHFSMEDINESLSTMSLNDIMAQGDDSLFIDNGKTQMIVTEKAGEDLKLEDILPKGEDVSNWSQANGTVTVAGVEYNVYQNNGGDAEVMVPQHLMQEQQH